MPEKFVCPDCVDDYAIKEFIHDNAEAHTCSYCGMTAEDETGEPIAADFDSVASFIRRLIRGSYEDPANSVGYGSAEGGYLLPTMDGWDLLLDVGLDGSNQGFLDDLQDGLSEHDWVKQDPYGSWEDEALQYSWERFAEQVKHEARFVFFKLSTSPLAYPDPEPYAILEEIGGIVTKLELFQRLPIETVIVRARQHASTSAPSNAADLGAPPKECAGQSRMSPAGIPMFYGAEDEATAFVEVFSNEPRKPCVTFATFKTLRPLTLLDLTSIPSVPSFFDENAAHVRMALSFMQSFEADATAPVPHDESQHYRYVPTQVVAEFFRHVFVLPEGSKLDGIIFNSSKNARKCYTLFVDSGQCADPSTSAGKTLVLSSHRTTTIDFATETYA